MAPEPQKQGESELLQDNVWDTLGGIKHNAKINFNCFFYFHDVVTRIFTIHTTDSAGLAWGLVSSARLSSFPGHVVSATPNHAHQPRLTRQAPENTGPPTIRLSRVQCA